MRSADDEDRASVAVNVERVAERILEDEAIRGNLSDDAFEPLQNAAISLAIRRSSRYRAADALHRDLKRLLAGAVEAVKMARPELFLESVVEPLIGPSERASMLPRLISARGSATGLAVQIASLIDEMAASTGD